MTQGLLVIAMIFVGYYVLRSNQWRLMVFWAVCAGCVFFKLSLFLTSVVSWSFTLFLWAVWTILYVEAHWLFCWHYYVCSVEVKRRISFNYETKLKE